MVAFDRGFQQLEIEFLFENPCKLTAVKEALSTTSKLLLAIVFHTNRHPAQRISGSISTPTSSPSRIPERTLEGINLDLHLISIIPSFT